MADYLATSTDLTSVANAIRSKGGTSAQLVFPTGFVNAINAITTGQVSIDQNVTDLAALFNDNTAISKVKIPWVTAVNARAFNGCTKLTEVELAALTAVPSYCFNGDTALLTVKLPACTSIATYSFSGCSALQSLYLMGSTVATLANKNAFNNTPSTLKIYVPSSLVTQYKAANNWTNFASQIYAG